MVSWIQLDNILTKFEISDGTILMCDTFSFALIRWKNFIYLFKSTCSLTDHALLLKFGSITEVPCFIM